MKRSNILHISLAMLGLIMLTVSSCREEGKTDKNEKPVAGKDKVYKGELKLLCDAGLEPIIKQQIEVFEFIHDSVKVKTEYVNEIDALNTFVKSKEGVVVLSRVLEKNEILNFKNKDTFHVREMSVAYDAVAMIGNNSFNDASLTLEQLKAYFDPNSKTKMRMVFDNQNSSTVNYVVGKLGYRNKVSGSVYALKSVDEVIAYVEQNTEAIGFIPYSFIGDTDDDRVKATLKRIKILSLHTVNAKGEKVTVSANQSDISEGTYPLIRNINVLSRFTYGDNLEWLFMNFLYKEKGAKIFLKGGLIPVVTPERDINVNTGEMKTGN